MTTKLTLSAHRDVLDKAKKLARQRRTSVSAMFSRFVRLAALEGGGPKPLGRLTSKATGIIAMPRSQSDRQVLEEALLERHGRGL